MADETDGGALSQEALDELMNAVDTSASEFSMDVDADTTSSGEEAAAAESPLDMEDAAPAAAPQSSPAPAPYASSAALHMSSFDMADAPVAGGGTLSGFNRVQDIPLELTVELGRTRLLIKDILELGTGSIIELEKMAGEPVDLLANGLLIARGEVVVIEDNFGVRITEIITSAARKSLSEDPLNLSAA